MKCNAFNLFFEDIKNNKLSVFFTTDYRDKSRIGLLWDIGTFERVASDAGGSGGGEALGY